MISFWGCTLTGCKSAYSLEIGAYSYLLYAPNCLFSCCHNMFNANTMLTWLFFRRASAWAGFLHAFITFMLAKCKEKGDQNRMMKTRWRQSLFLPGIVGKEIHIRRCRSLELCHNSGPNSTQIIVLSWRFISLEKLLQLYCSDTSFQNYRSFPLLPYDCLQYHNMGPCTGKQIWITVIWQQKKKNGSVLYFKAKSVPHCMRQGGPTKGCVGVTEGRVLDHRIGEHNLKGLKRIFSKVGWLQKFLYTQCVNVLLPPRVKGTGNECMKRSWIYGRCNKK